MRLPESRPSQFETSHVTCDRTATHCRQAATKTKPLWSLLPQSMSHLLKVRRRVLESSIADDLVIWRAIWLWWRGHQRLRFGKASSHTRRRHFDVSHSRVLNHATFLLLSRCDLRITLRAACRQAIWPESAPFAVNEQYNELGQRGQPQMMSTTNKEKVHTNAVCDERIRRAHRALREWHSDQSRVKTVCRTQVTYFALQYHASVPLPQEDLRLLPHRLRTRAGDHAQGSQS